MRTASGAGGTESEREGKGVRMKVCVLVVHCVLFEKLQ